jgi:hypothetical protein
MEWVPLARSEVVNVAFALLSVPIPSTVAPSLNVTAPVGVPEVAGLTVAVKVTALPNADGFAEESSVVEVAAFPTVCVRAEEVLAL